MAVEEKRLKLAKVIPEGERESEDEVRSERGTVD
jgi:hypothetical protein